MNVLLLLCKNEFNNLTSFPRCKNEFNSLPEMQGYGFNDILEMQG